MSSYFAIKIRNAESLLKEQRKRFYNHFLYFILLTESWKNRFEFDIMCYISLFNILRILILNINIKLVSLVPK